MLQTGHASSAGQVCHLIAPAQLKVRRSDIQSVQSEQSAMQYVVSKQHWQLVAMATQQQFVKKHDLYLLAHMQFNALIS